MTDGTPLTPTEALVLEVLAARHRLGETFWTFDARAGRAIRSLADRGMVNEMSGMVEKTVRASLTTAGLEHAIDENYLPPRETQRLTVRNRILAALHELEQPDAAALATFLSYRLEARS